MMHLYELLQSLQSYFEVLILVVMDDALVPMFVLDLLLISQLS